MKKAEKAANDAAAAMERWQLQNSEDVGDVKLYAIKGEKAEGAGRVIRPPPQYIIRSVDVSSTTPWN